MLLKNKVAVITGAASVRGLGFATAKLYAEQGAKVVIIDLNAEASRAAAASLGDEHLGLAANVSNELQVNAAIEQVLGKYGRIDILVNNAGITQPIKLMDIKRENYDAVLDVSLRGTLLMSRAVIPTMRAQSRAASSAFHRYRPSAAAASLAAHTTALQKRVCWGWQKPWRVSWGPTMCA